ncbi:MAG TPA: hypothetical protein DD384_04130 [Firmicutes bacterium]|nr:hypothetical protein [Bacillota bacterium]
MIDLITKKAEEKEFSKEIRTLFEGLEEDDGIEETAQFQEEKENRKEENSSMYKIINTSKLEKGERPLEKVVGHEEQKKELLFVIDWFKHSKELSRKGVSIPRGVILFGEPGNGKTLLIKEIVKCCEAPVFVFQGEEDDVVKGVYETFKKARETGHSIIIFDELDLLISKERRVIRALQENLEGVESSDDILVLAATNDIDDIPYALLRSGRFEKSIEIPNPTGEEALELLKKHFKEFNLELPEDFDDEEMALSLNDISCASVKSVVNDLVLRNGFENITNEMIESSICRIAERNLETSKANNMEIAIHEAGHALVAKAFPQFFIVNRLNISNKEGKFTLKEVDENFWPYEKVVADIKISMAGVIAEKIICGRGSRGCEDDLQRARKDAYNLFNMCGYSSCWETLPPIGQNSRTDTFIKRRKMERKIEAFLKKCEKETTKYIKYHKDQVSKLGKLLLEKKHLKSSEILSCIG